MDNTQPTKYPCPKCHYGSQSVAAINLAETQHWEQSGTFSGVGVGGGGLGLGVGTFSSHGKSQSKRAEEFDSPAKAKLPLVSIVLGVVVLALAVSSIPSMMGALIEATPVVGAAPESLTVGVAASADNITKVLFPIAIPMLLLGVFYFGYMNLKEGAREEEDYNKNELPKKLARYNELRYCAHCNTLFDNDSNIREANEFGFRSLMKL